MTNFFQAKSIVLVTNILKIWVCYIDSNNMYLQGELGKWSFKSKNHDTYYEGYMFPLLVHEQLDIWPEMNLRRRIWVRTYSPNLK